MKNEYLSNAIKNRVFIRSSFFFLFYVLGFINKYSLGRIQMESIYRKYKKKLDIKINKSYEIEKLSEKKIWIMWYQGIDNAPDVVKNCYNSLIDHKPKNYDVVLLDKNNLFEYANLPSDIVKLFNEKKLSFAAFSDIVRLNLLIKYGGFWVDSTCLFIDKIPDFIFDLDLFVFKSGYKNLEIPNFQSWFIFSKPNNPILVNTYENLIRFTQKFKGFPHYFFMFFILQMVSEELTEEWSKIPFVNDLNCYTYDENNINFNESIIKKFVFVQKLSYKKG